MSNRIEHLPRVVHSDQYYPNRDPEVAAATNCRSATQIVFQRADVESRSAQPRNYQAWTESAPI